MMNRKQFLKKSLIGTGALLLLPSLGKMGKTKAMTRIETDVKPEPHLWKNTGVDVAWIGHSTVLINFFGVKILTDPILFERIGVYFLGTTIGQNRYTHPALTPDEMIQPDIILLSHAHLDHMDYRSLLFLTEKFPGKISCITAKNTGDVINDLQWKSLQELDWNEVSSIDGIQCKAIEVKHFGFRFPWENDRSRGTRDGRSFNAYAMEMNGKRIVFGGDTAYTENFKSAGISPVDIAIMPIGAYNPWHKVHANPEESLAMAQQMNTKYFLPVHFYTFRQSQEPITEPLTRLKNSAEKYSVTIGWDTIGSTFHLLSE
jgi:L-ascorbate metabolism protein UlaG (beta-lactamase superfamily)